MFFVLFVGMLKQVGFSDFRLLKKDQIGRKTDFQAMQLNYYGFSRVVVSKQNKNGTKMFFCVEKITFFKFC